MQTYTLKEPEANKDIFDLAKVEPVLLTEQTEPSHVIMSVEAYQKLIQRLAELEDLVWGKAAEAAIEQSHKVGVEKFVSTLEQLANGEA